MTRLHAVWLVVFCGALAALGAQEPSDRSWVPGVQKAPETSPPLSPADEIGSEEAVRMCVTRRAARATGLRDRLTGRTERVSISANGTQGDDSSFNPSISADGRYVVFESEASNLIPGEINGPSHVYVRDREAQRTELAAKKIVP